MKCGVRIKCDPPHLVKNAKAVGFEPLPRPRLRSPQIPWQHLDLIERREVAHKIAGNEPETKEVDKRNAKQFQGRLRQLGISARPPRQ